MQKLNMQNIQHLNIQQINQIPYTLYEVIIQIITSQNFKQKVNMVISVSMELYRVMITSLLLIFIPQQCGDHTCTITENTYNKEYNYFIGLIINYITVCSFIVMYFTEMRREEKLIKLLEVNDTISTDNISVGKRIEMFPEYKKQQLFIVDLQYQISSLFVLIVFVINTTYSGMILYNHSLGNQTIINYITNILFMFSKLSTVFVIINTDKNIFFSAYMNTKVQFNDIDPREMNKIENHYMNLMMDDIHEDSKIQLLEQGGFIFLD